MSQKRSARSAGARSREYLSATQEQNSVCSDRGRSQRSLRSETRSSRSQSHSSMVDAGSPRPEVGEPRTSDKANEELHEKTKEALGSLVLRKDELESKGIETEMIYQELMNCVSPWRRKKLQEDAAESQASLEEVLRNADDMMKQAKAAFEAYQTMQDPKRREAAAGDLFWKTKAMHKTLAACVQVSCNAEGAKNQLAWADKMGKIMNSMISTFRILDDMKTQLSKERARTMTLSSRLQKGDEGFVLDPAAERMGDEAGAALLLVRSHLTAAAPVAARPALVLAACRQLLQNRRLDALLAAVLLAAAGYWALPSGTFQQLPHTLLTAVGLGPSAPPTWWEYGQGWLAGVLYSLLYWMPGVCSSDQPVTIGPLCSLTDTTGLF